MPVYIHESLACECWLDCGEACAQCGRFQGRGTADASWKVSFELGFKAGKKRSVSCVQGGMRKASRLRDTGSLGYIK
jgi:hypothetical protein